MTARPTARRRAAIGALVAACCIALLGVVGPAAAQDPYGGTTTTSTTEPPELEPACALSLTAGAPGASASVRVTNVPLGATVRILLGGSEVGRATAPVQGQAAVTTLDIAFTVPDLAPGRYLATAVGADFTLRCGPDADGLFEVLGSSQGQGGSGVGGGSLPRTGIYVGLLLALALALFLAGRALLSASRRRAEQAERAPAAPAARR